MNVSYKLHPDPTPRPLTHKRHRMIRLGHPTEKHGVNMRHAVLLHVLDANTGILQLLHIIPRVPDKHFVSARHDQHVRPFLRASDRFHCGNVQGTIGFAVEAMVGIAAGFRRGDDGVEFFKGVDGVVGEREIDVRREKNGGSGKGEGRMGDVAEKVGDHPASGLRNKRKWEDQ